MRYSISNEHIRAEIDSHGAELKSVIRVSDGHEYMWYADAAYWGRTSPVLFPIVGSVQNKELQCKGTVYPMGQHGFARDMEHTMISRTDDTIWFELRSDEETRAKYPYDFVLRIGYVLSGDSVKVIWRVANPSDTALDFSIGAHPAFLCPADRIPEGSTPAPGCKAGYRIFFGGDAAARGELHYNVLDNASGLALDEDHILKLTDRRAVITPEFFDRCAYIFENKQCGEVAIETPDGNPYITVRFDTPLFAIWSPEKKNAPFICIEPWFGRCDSISFHGDVHDRKYNNTLEAGQEFEASYDIIFS